jgi:hypothetical protein
MRRKNALSVRVRNPSRGLVTRLPSDEADQMRPGDTDRAFIDANNVRFEDGVTRAAPGYSKVIIGSDLITGIFAYWKMDEAQSSLRRDSVDGKDMTPYDNSTHPITQVPGVNGDAAKIPFFAGIPTVSMGLIGDPDLNNLSSADYTVTMSLKFENAFPASSTFFNSNAFQLQIRTGGTLRISGSSSHIDSGSSLVLGTWYHIVVAYTQSTGSTDFYVNGSLAGTAVLGTFVGADFLFSKTALAAVTVDNMGVWKRTFTSGDVTDLYNSGAVLDYPFFQGPISLLMQGNVINSDVTKRKPFTIATGGDLWSVARSFDPSSGEFQAILNSIYPGTPPTDTSYAWSAVDFFDKEVYAQRDNTPQYWTPDLTLSQAVPGLPTVDDKWDGVESFFDHLILWKDDRFKWSARNDFTTWIPIGSTAASWVMTVDTGGFTQPMPGSNVTIPTVENPNTKGVVNGQFIQIPDVQSSLTYYNIYQVVSHTGSSITVTLQAVTGVTATGLTVNAGDSIFSMDANEAGESQNVGSHVNGPIFQILSQGDYAYIFKERSIQSIQYVGLQSGIFFVHPEIANEGLLARNALLGLGDGRMIFVGHREIYSYQGGPTLTPICQQFSRQMYSELDRARLDTILLFHKEFKNEIWIQYPVLGGAFKVLIWNYREDSVSIDTYDTSLNGLTAVAEVEWSVDPSWESLPDSLTWDSVSDMLTWDSFSGSGADRFTLMATGDNQLLIHGGPAGQTFNRNGAAYPTQATTEDYDLGEPDMFKYVDVVVVGIHVKSPPDTTVRRLFIELGYRDWLDDDVKYRPAFSVQVQGNYKPPPLRINPGGAGRFLRLRFSTTDADVDWSVTSYEIHTRAGSFY